MALTTPERPHALYAMLLKCGAVEAIEVSEEQGAHAGSLPSDGAGSADAADAAGADGGADVAVADSPAAELPDQPVDYLLHTTEAGRAALDEFEPAKRFSELLAAEPTATAMPTGACSPSARRGPPRPP